MRVDSTKEPFVFKPYTNKEAAETLRKAAKEGTAQIKRAFFQKSPFLRNGYGVCPIGLLVLTRIREVVPEDSIAYIAGSLEPNAVQVILADKGRKGPVLDIRAKDLFSCVQAQKVWNNVVWENDYENKSFSEIADYLER